VKPLAKLACAVLLAAACTTVSASTITYTVAWSGVDWGNTETVNGTVTLDSTAYGHSDPYDMTGFLALDVVTSVDPTHHYTLADFTGYYWLGAPGANLAGEQIGQLWDFNIFGNVLVGSGPFTLDDSSTGNSMQMVSMIGTSAAIPEPTTLALLGVAGLGFLRRRKAA
jgi:hypothetical protein